MKREDSKPYMFARRRLDHARLVLTDADRSVHERLLDALVALAPLRVEDLPRRCYVFYERVQNLVGASLWSDVATAGSLAPAVRALSLRQATDAARWILMSGDTLNRQSMPDSIEKPAQQTEPATAIRQDDDRGPQDRYVRGFYLT